MSNSRIGAWIREAPPSLIALAGPNGAGKSTAGPARLKDTLGVSEFVNPRKSGAEELNLAHK